jgi:hypothetical protein
LPKIAVSEGDIAAFIGEIAAVPGQDYVTNTGCQAPQFLTAYQWKLLAAFHEGKADLRTYIAAF